MGFDPYEINPKRKIEKTSNLLCSLILYCIYTKVLLWINWKIIKI